MKPTKDENRNGIHGMEWAKRLEIEALKKNVIALEELNNLLRGNYELLKGNYEELKIRYAVLSRDVKRKAAHSTHLNANMKIVD